jgi:hypothetical protein
MFYKTLKLLCIFSLFSLLLLNHENGIQAADGKPSAVDSLQKMIELNNRYSTADKNKDQLLLSMGQTAMQMEIAIEEFNKKTEYKNICHLRIVKSANFGDFVSYDGYHFKKILKDYPKSQYADDAAYELIYVIPDEYNYKDLRDEKNKLELFLQKYPQSNLKNKAKKRYAWIVEYLKKGEQPIID